MRAGVIFQLIKDDWYGSRWMILCCLLIPMLLEVLLIWQREDFYTWLQGLGVGEIGVSSIASGVLVCIPYALIWMMLVTRLTGEASSGFYSFVRVMPITAEELVTSKFVSSFVLSVGAALWFAVLWWIYDQGFSQLTDFKVWGAIYLIGLFFPIWLALHHGLFFRSGAKGTGSVYLLFVLVIFLGQRHFVKQGMEWFTATLQDFPFLTVAVGAVLLVVVWLLCWRWALITYRKFINGTLKPSIKQRKRRTTE